MICKALNPLSTETHAESVLRVTLKLSCVYAETVLRSEAQKARKALPALAILAVVWLPPCSSCL
nr:hypothetical protein [bacterium]